VRCGCTSGYSARVATLTVCRWWANNEETCEINGVDETRRSLRHVSPRSQYKSCDFADLLLWGCDNNITVATSFQLSIYVFWYSWNRSQGRCTVVWMTGVRFLTRTETFLCATASQLVMGPTQSPLQWVRRVPSPGGQSDQSVKLIIHLHLVPKLIHGATSSLH
jgi:hypothetical protein